MEIKTPNRQFLIGVVAFVATILFGLSGYVLAGWPLLDALYMVIITIFGVGYGEVMEMSPNLRIFTIVFIVLGCTSLIYTVGAFINWLTEGQLQKALGKRIMEKEINRLEDHTVICGYGRVGRLLASSLQKAGRSFLIVDSSEEQIEEIKEMGYLFITGDATDERILKKAGIQRAGVLATVIPNDAVNVFIVLSCRALNPGLRIIARANYVSSEAKLLQAGTDKVVMPANIGADRIAHLILRPNAQEVLEQDLKDNAFVEGLQEIGLEISEIDMKETPHLVGQRLVDLETKGKSTFMVIAVRRTGGGTIIKPALDLKLENEDTLVVMSHEGLKPDFILSPNKHPEIRYRGAIS